MAKFKEHAVVEQLQYPDVPMMIVGIAEGAIVRYELVSIDGGSYGNVPEYSLVPARPPQYSQWGPAITVNELPEYEERKP